MGYLAWVSMSSLAAACYCVTGSPHQAPNLPSMAEGGRGCGHQQFVKQQQQHPTSRPKHNFYYSSGHSSRLLSLI